MTQEPMEAWTDYAKRSGLLNDQGVAEDRAKAQTAYFAFVAAWNLSWEANKHLASQQPEQEPVGYWKEHAQGMQRDYDLLLADYEKLAQPEQGPVAWRTFDGEGGYDYRSYEDNESYADDWDKRNPNHKGWVEPLYTTSQKRTWVGLTVEEVEKIWQGVEASDFHDCVQPFAQAIENILKDKNCVG